MKMKIRLNTTIRVRTVHGEAITIEPGERFIDNVYEMSSDSRRATGLIEPEYTHLVECYHTEKADFFITPEQLENAFTVLTELKEGQRYRAIQDTAGHVRMVNASPSPVPIKKGDVVRVYVYGHNTSFVRDNEPKPYYNCFNLNETTLKTSPVDLPIPDPAFFELLPAE